MHVAQSRWLPRPLDGVEALVGHLVAGERDPAVRAALALQSAGTPYPQIAAGWLQPALYEVGRRWQRREITVAQEHLATALCQDLLLRVLAQSPFAEPCGRRAVFAAVEGNRHALGVRIVADTFEMAGWEVHFLGADTPTRDLVAHVGAERPDLVGLSASLPTQLPVLRGAIAALGAELGARRPSVLVGGLATNQVEGIWRRLGADDWRPHALAAELCAG